MKCQFAEKLYEQCLNYELITDRRFYAPTQNGEGVMGIDAAIFTNNPLFLGLFGLQNSSRLPGVHLNPALWENSGRRLDNTIFPRFRYNLFVQHKRPEYIKSPRGREYPDWGEPYFRYDLEAGQQEILSRFEQHVQNDALVVYSCPAFWTVEEFTNYYATGSLTTNSNFVKPSDLDGHGRYTFTTSGIHGIGYSEKKHIELTNIKEEIQRLSKIKIRFEKNSQFINELAHDIEEVMKKIEGDTYENYRVIFTKFESADSVLENSLAKIFSFLLITNLSWLVGYGK